VLANIRRKTATFHAWMYSYCKWEQTICNAITLMTFGMLVMTADIVCVTRNFLRKRARISNGKIVCNDHYPFVGDSISGVVGQRRSPFDS